MASASGLTQYLVLAPLAVLFSFPLLVAERVICAFREASDLIERTQTVRRLER